MSLKSLGWGFLSENLLDSERKPVLFSCYGKIGFPSHEYVSKAFSRLGRDDAFADYRDSFIGLHTRINGNHIYGPEHQENENVLLGARSVATGWLSNRNNWIHVFEDEYKKGRSVFLSPVNVEGVLTNSVLLWGTDSMEVSWEIKQAMLQTFRDNNWRGGYSEWTKVVTRHHISTLDVARACLNVPTINSIFAEPIYPVASIIYSLSKRYNAELSGQDFTEWMFLYFRCRAGNVNSKELLEGVFSEAMSLGVTPSRFEKLRSDGVSLRDIPTCLAYDIDPHLVGSL